MLFSVQFKSLNCPNDSEKFPMLQQQNWRKSNVKIIKIRKKPCSNSHGTQTLFFNSILKSFIV